MLPLQHALFQWNSLLWKGIQDEEFPHHEQKWVEWLRHEGLRHWQQAWLSGATNTTPPAAYPPFMPQHAPSTPLHSNQPLASLKIHYANRHSFSSEECIFLVPPPSHRATIFHLASDDSLIEAFCQKGYDVITIEWNDQLPIAPTWNDYRTILTQHINSLPTALNIHLMGLCLGGILLLDLLAPQQKQASKPFNSVKSLTLLSSLLDYRCTNPLSCFSLSPLRVGVQHYLKWLQWIPAPLIYASCCLLLPSNHPSPTPPSPLREWSQNGLNVSAPFARELLDAFYSHHTLLIPSNGYPRLSEFDTPLYIVNGLDDKLIPIEGVFSGLHYFPPHSAIRLVLSEAGHLRCFLPKKPAKTLIGNWAGESKEKWMRNHSTQASECYWLDDWHLWRQQSTQTNL